MRYTNPRFQQMRPSYERSQGSFGTRTGSGQEVGQEGVFHPGLLASGGVPYEIHEAANAPEHLPVGLGTPTFYPAFQQGWPPQAFAPSQEIGPMGIVGPQRFNAPVQLPGTPFPQSFPPYASQGALEQPAWAQRNVPSAFGQSPQGQMPLPSQEGWGPQPFAGRPEGTLNDVRQPAFDLIDEGDTLVFEIELPGVSKTDVQLVCNENGVSVRASAKEDQHEDDAYLHAERGRVRYERYIPLGIAIVPDKAKASFQNGILTVTCQKQQPSSGLQKVEIK